VRPYSTAAWRASVIQAVDVAAANNCREVILTTGGRSEKFAMQLRPDLPEVAFVEMGIFTGAALLQCRKDGMQRVGLCGMIGKFSKLAHGHFQTHVAGNQVDFEFLAEVAARCGAATAIQDEIRAANTARHFAEIIEAYNLELAFQLIAELTAARSYTYIDQSMTIETILVDFEGQVLGRTVCG
jgi:cobalt-precorrin-5B (C1)-methyltransferase